MQHEWFKNTEHHYKLDKNAVDRLVQFKGTSKLKQAALNMLVKMADSNQIEKLRE